MSGMSPVLCAGASLDADILLHVLSKLAHRAVSPPPHSVLTAVMPLQSRPHAGQSC